MSANPVSDFEELCKVNPSTGNLNVSVTGCYDYLGRVGYRALVNEKDFELYRVQKQWIESVYPVQLQSAIVDYFTNPKTAPEPIDIWKGKREPECITYEPKDMLEVVTKYGLDKITKEANFNHLPRADFKEKRHTKDKAYFYFKNGFIEITKDGIELKPYTALQWQVNKNRFINKDIEVLSNPAYYGENVAKRGACFIDFLQKICLVPVQDGQAYTHQQDGENFALSDTKYQYLGELIGYLLHDYKLRGITDFAVILCDDEAGGSGKGIIVQALKQMFGNASDSVAEVDCKTDDMKFAPEALSRFTRLKVYSDVARSFPLQRIYNECAEDISVRKMHRAPFSLPFEDSYKLIVTANHVIKGSKSSDIRRQRVFDLYPFFNEKRQVREYYKHSFFSDEWTGEDWIFFYNAMFKCVQMWLSLNYDKSFRGFTDNMYQSRKIQETYISEFVQYIEGLEREVWHKTGELYENFLTATKNENGQYSNKFIAKHIAGNPNIFGRMLTDYCRDNAIKIAKTTNRSQIKLYR